VCAPERAGRQGDGTVVAPPRARATPRDRQQQTSIPRQGAPWRSGAAGATGALGEPRRSPVKRVSPYLKMRVLGAIEFAPGRTNVERIRHVAGLVFTDEDNQRFQFTWRTIQTWYSRFKKDGVTSVRPVPRSDRGHTRKVRPEEVQEAIEQVLPRFRGPTNVSAIYRACIEHGLLCRERIAPNTFRRIVKKYELLKPETESHDRRRLAFAKAHANQMWQADTMYGPYVHNGGGHTQTRLIAFIDDASRVCCHAEFFLAENTDTLIKALRSALYKRGVPESLYVDNGSIYTSAEITQICTRLGCLLCHAPLRDGAAKGKVERFFRTVRMSFLTRALDLSSVEALNRAFNPWVEDEYNAREHSSLGMRPIDRFGLDLSRIRFLPPNEANDELFFMEQERSVLADNTFSLKRVRYEAPRDLRSRKIQVRFDRRRLERVVVFYKGERMGEARPVDLEANDRPARNSTRRHASANTSASKSTSNKESRS
jgi:putative transposase